MKWRLTIPGQPLSYNQSLEIHKFDRRSFNRGGGEFRKIGKTAKAVAYTNEVASRASSARPSGWHPTGFVVVEYYYFLGRYVDADNVMKLVDDGLKIAIGVDDRWFLPRAMSIVTGLRPPERRVELLIYELKDGGSP
ncbi:MAG TPA: hypothetical protein VFP22_04725 [Candidatus Limnocylindrales bacterium]|nr:hypothetical protein [Candidatus Limnocylindrales bacterium]